MRVLKREMENVCKRHTAKWFTLCMNTFEWVPLGNSPSESSTRVNIVCITMPSGLHIDVYVERGRSHE